MKAFGFLYFVSHVQQKPTFITMALIIEMVGISLDNGPLGSGNVEVDLKDIILRD